MSGTLARVLSSLALLGLVLAAPVHPSAVGIAPQPAASLLSDFQWRNIGPANMAGRVTDIEALDADFSTVLVAAASGGVFKSTNAGTTWEPIFDHYGTASIGDVAFFQPDPNIIWVGTGESCVRNSVGWGDGVYKSTDGGKTFTNMGLGDTHHIAEVTTHPTDPDIVYVAAQGHLWGHTGERGVFKTTDGGRTWERLTNGLPDDGRTGATDLKMDPKNPNVLYAAYWERLRRPHRFDSGGPNGGIFKTTDGGRTWQKLTSGLPEGPTGKIGLSIHRANPSILVAIVEHGFQPDQSDPDYEDLTKLGTGIYRSEDAGRTWRQVSRYNNRPFYYSHIYLHPTDRPDRLRAGGQRERLDDGGATFSGQLPSIGRRLPRALARSREPEAVLHGQRQGRVPLVRRRRHREDVRQHGDRPVLRHHARQPRPLLGVRRPAGQRQLGRAEQQPRRQRHPQRPLVQVPQRRRVPRHGRPERLAHGLHGEPGRQHPPARRGLPAGGRQHHAQRRRPSRTTPSSRQPKPKPQRAAADAAAVGAASRRRSGSTGARRSSSRQHDSRTVLFGGNHLFRSTDRGDTWTIISPDLSTNNPELTNRESGGITRDVTGAETHGTIVTIGESPVSPGSSGSAPTTATCRSRATAERAGPTCARNVSGRAVGALGEPRRGVALRRGHRLRHVRRAPERQLRALDLQDRRLRPDVDQRSRTACRPAARSTSSPRA